MSQSKHTPAPWVSSKIKTSSGHCFRIGSQEQIDKREENKHTVPAYACLYVDYMNAHEEAEANANHIVHCVNMHDELMEALEMCVEYLEDRPIVRVVVDKAIAKAKGGGNV